MDGSNPPFTIRQARDDEAQAIQRLVTEVVTEIYGHLFAETPLPAIDESRSGSLVVEADSAIVGVGLAKGDHIDDIWLKPRFRDRGIGSVLLSSLEAQIEQGGHPTARLRVVAENQGAVRFYLKHSWQVTNRYPHELWAFEMLDMTKYLHKQR